MKRLLLLLAVLVSVGCGASPEVRDYLEKLGPPKNHVAEVETLRQAAYKSTFEALKVNATEPWARIIALREPSVQADTESAKQLSFLMSNRPPSNMQGYWMAYTTYLQSESSYFQAMHTVDALLDTIPRGGAPPSLGDLQQDDAGLAKLAARLAEDFPKVQATYERAR